ncbi:MAG: hypothetical protein ACYS1A_13045 [Planctomycetota bacterium]|jgi:hypothetical protein
MMTRNVSLTILIIFTTLFLSNPVFSQEESENNESNEKEKVKSKPHVSGELIIDESCKKEKIKSKTRVSGELRIIDESNEKEKVKRKIQVSGELKLIDVSDKKEAKNKSKISGWTGYNYYKMSHFNAKLSSEGNKTINGGLNMGLEFTPKKFTLKLSELLGHLPMIKFPDPSVELPTSFSIGFEYLEAQSRTIHGGTTTVNWELPVTGIYFSPEIDFSKKPEKSEGFSLKLCPIGVGYYMLGKLIDAKLTLTGASGHLKLSGSAIGITSLATIKYKQKDFEVFVDGGYRWLEFTDVLREPKGGFASGAPASQLPESLDYSGFIIRAGITWRF